MKNISIKTTIALLLLSYSAKLFAQQGVSINSSGAAADNSALLDMSSTTKGLLMPRMTTADRNAIVSPAEGLQIYNTTTKCFEAYVNNAWNTVSCPSACNPPIAPVATAAGSPDCTTFVANWNSSNGATTYFLDVATDIGFSFILPAYNNLNVGNVNLYNVTGLTTGTNYYYRVRASTSCASGNSNIITTTTASTGCPCTATPTVTDIDGNTYNTLQIGAQCWMKENLKAVTYNNSTAIPNVTDNTDWSNNTTGAYCDYSNNPANSITYGRLYNYYAVVNGNGLCPSGWHVPTDGEWCTMENTVEAGTDASCNTTGFRGTTTGGKLKEAGTSHWVSPNTGATNSSAFTALPAGFRFSYGVFASRYDNGTFWTSSESSSSNAWYRYLFTNSAGIDRNNDYKTDGFTVRCIKN